METAEPQKCDTLVSGLTTIAAGNRHSVGLTWDGTVVAVGDNKYGQCDVSNLSNMKAVAAGNAHIGNAHTIGLTSHGTVAAVGWNKHNQCDVSDWRDIVAVAAGWRRTVGLKSDGSVVAIGRNNEGQCDVSNWRSIQLPGNSLLIFGRSKQMISATTAKMINILPDKWVTYISKKILDRYLKKYANINIEGSENLKGIQTPTIFICNHLSNSDGLVLDKALKEIDPTFVAGEKLSNNAVTSIGVHVIKTTNIKPNTADKEGIEKIIKLVKQGGSLLIFPEGTRSRTSSLIEAKKGVLLIARMTGAPIVPIGLYGTEKLLPINNEGDMKAEAFHHADVHINIGKQFEIHKREKAQDKKEYEDDSMTYMMKKIAELLPEHYRGVYK